MQPGPPRKPTALKLLEGNPGEKRLPVNEPKPPMLRAADCPAFLLRDAYAKAEWERIAPVLIGLGLLTELDLSALAVYCQTFAEWTRAVEKLQQTGVLYKSKESGWVMVSPLFSVSQRCADQLRKLLAEFGLSPAARARLSVKPTEESETDTWTG